MTFGGGFPQQPPIAPQPGPFDVSALGQSTQYAQNNTWNGGGPGNTHFPQPQQYNAQLHPDASIETDTDAQGGQQPVGADLMAEFRQFKERLEALQSGSYPGYYLAGGFVPPPPAPQPQQAWAPQAVQQQQAWAPPTAPPPPPHATQRSMQRASQVYPPCQGTTAGGLSVSPTARQQATQASGPSRPQEPKLPKGFRSHTVARDLTHNDAPVQLLFSGEVEFVVVNPVAVNPQST
ncbi:hypothetical protein AURDEDRAFT_129958 [Auricularia subglabra TFB-10046 SS5]|nr:hypothetical protein AURDEDRAFT_129958 [Auricularia subglabra TFB-10046 SS5]